MPDYDAIEPEAYLARFGRVARERYLRNHWHPLTQAAINRYCRGRRVLDLGCGFGDYTQQIKCAGMPIGIDIATRWLGYARESAGIAVIRGDAQYLPLGPGVCDAVLSVGLLEYVDADAVVGEIARVLRPGGFCVVAYTNKYSAYRLTLRLLLALRGRPHDAREVSLASLMRAMRLHGVDPVEIVMDDALIWLPDWVDLRLGTRVYTALEAGARRLGRNPLSNGILVVGRRRR